MGKCGFSWVESPVPPTNKSGVRARVKKNNVFPYANFKECHKY